jgi:hypothetical protein
MYNIVNFTEKNSQCIIRILLLIHYRAILLSINSITKKLQKIALTNEKVNEKLQTEYFGWKSNFMATLGSFTLSQVLSVVGLRHLLSCAQRSAICCCTIASSTTLKSSVENTSPCRVSNGSEQSFCILTQHLTIVSDVLVRRYSLIGKSSSTFIT